MPDTQEERQTARAQWESKWRWPGVLVIAVILALAAWMIYDVLTFEVGDVRTSVVELRHETREGGGPQIRLEPHDLNADFEDMQPLGPGEAVVLEMQIGPAGGWENAYMNGLVVRLAELPAGWVYDDVACTSPVSARYPFPNEHTFRLAFDALAVGENDISTTCTIWTKSAEN